MRLSELRNKKIILLGFGREGIDTFHFLRESFPQKIFGIGDRLELEKFEPKVINLLKKDRKITLHLGKNYLKFLKNYDIIIKSPGIPPKVLLPFLSKKQKIVTQTDIFFANCPTKIIGITGTKGKSTSSRAVYHVLKKGGLKVKLVGNIETPALSFLKNLDRKTIFVYELSSFQLQNLKMSPQYAILLNIFPDHLDYHSNFKEYLESKENIFKYQKSKDYLIFNRENPLSRKMAKKGRAQKFSFGLSFKKEPGCFLKNNWIYYFSFTKKEEKILEKKKIKLTGDFNLLNVMPAILLGKIFNLPTKKIAKALEGFKGAPHRLEFIGNYRGIKFYDDSAATVPQATQIAIETMEDSLFSLITGGSEKNLSFKRLAQKIVKSQIKILIFLPITGQKIWQAIKKEQKNTKIKSFFVNSMEEAVKIAYSQTPKGKICLLSCASASFGLFKNYKERGNLFKKYVKKYG